MVKRGKRRETDKEGVREKERTGDKLLLLVGAPVTSSLLPWSELAILLLFSVDCQGS